MLTKALKPSPQVAEDKKLQQICDRLCARWARRAPPLPGCVVGDLIVGLADLPPEDSSDRSPYCRMMHSIVKGNCWIHLTRYLDFHRTQNYAVLAFLAGLFCNRLWRIGNRAPSLGEEEFGLESKSLDPEAGDGEKTSEEGWLAGLADLYDRRTAGQADVSSGLVDDFAFVALNLGLRAANVKALRLWMNQPLVMACLGVEWDPLEYEPRLLRIVTRLGDKDEALPGDYLSVRGLTKKTREDQIHHIIPSELGLSNGIPSLGLSEEDGRMLTIDKIVNRSPLILEHFDTRHPDNRHRVFLLFIIDVEKAGFAGADPRAAELAEREAKAAAFDLLINGALRAPEKIEVEAEWMERRKTREGWRWESRGFRLNEVEPLRGVDESWHNLTKVDQLLPHFFVRSLAGQRDDLLIRSKQIVGEPSERLSKAIYSRRYEVCLVVHLTAEGQETRTLPPAYLRLPRPDPGMNTVLLVTQALPGKEETEADNLRGEAFRDLSAAWAAPRPMDLVRPVDLSCWFLQMLVGPGGRAASPVRVVV